ncbi:MAG: hypothetical protein M3Y72_20210 [Acidobacteriota bacterium]|nr:hypothetical protein [Acidobacteriota bacterium]
MNDAYFQPWIGKHYDKNRTLILSESTYDWIGEDGNSYTPQPDHASDGISWQIEHFSSKRGYFTALIRSICDEETPSKERMSEVWNEYAYTPYVQSSVGNGPGIRPSTQQWEEAKPHFLNLIERLRPQKVIVTGIEMWKTMPECDAKLVDDLQAYRLVDGSFVWCLALPHPASRTAGKGFAWRDVASSIKLFRETGFPPR